MTTEALKNIQDPRRLPAEEVQECLAAASVSGHLQAHLIHIYSFIHSHMWTNSINIYILTTFNFV